MVAETQIASYTDLSRLAQLRARVGENDPNAVRAAAREFEALFLQMMLGSMRDAGSALAEPRDRTYEEMFDQQISLELAQRDSLGIADLLLRQIGVAAGKDNVEPIAVDHTAAAVSTRRRDDFKPADARTFVAEVWPLAQATGEELGIDPRAIVAQAALETGWGDQLVRDRHGVSGNNLFGIKADADWQGERIAVSTLEYEGDRFVPRREQFRAYPTLADGFAGYAQFLSNETRYNKALERGANPQEFARELQAAGYATDPDYAAKLERIMTSDRLAEFVQLAEQVR